MAILSRTLNDKHDALDVFTLWEWDAVLGGCLHFVQPGLIDHVAEACNLCIVQHRMRGTYLFMRYFTNCILHTGWSCLFVRPSTRVFSEITLQ
jgi:hypothetical protein